MNQNADAIYGKMKSLDFLKEQAVKLGAADAKIISVDRIVIEDRVVLKCKLGCEKYGQTLACPPYAPKPEEIRKIAKEYQHALFMKFSSCAKGDAKLIRYLSKANEQNATPEVKAEVERFWSNWNNDLKKLLNTVLKLEKIAGEQGYLLAVGFISGSCQLCEKCNLEKGLCVNPAKRRFSLEAVGINVKATAEKAGVKFTLPFIKNPETFALLLIE